MTSETCSPGSRKCSALRDTQSPRPIVPKAALERTEAEEFDLVILDIRMPGMSGLDASSRSSRGIPSCR